MEPSPLPAHVEELIATVSHELRTPLHAVLGWAELLGRDRIDPVRSVKAIATIQRNARAMARIIDDLFDMTRITGGEFRIHTQPVDLVAVIEAALDDVRLPSQEAGVQLNFACHATTGGTVAGDALRLRQVVTNLVSNAIKFTPSGGRIDVDLRSRTSELEIRVADTGVGIAGDFLPRIFERFAQAAPAGTSRQGLGLGLAIVRALVERHGGVVEAASPGVGQGATFTVRLPVASAAVSNGAERPGC